MHYPFIVVRYGQGARAPARVFDGEKERFQRILSDKQDQTNATPGWLRAVRAAEAKKATDIKVLDLGGITSFTDHFVICTGANQRQIQTICDEVTLRLKQAGEMPLSVEGYTQAEWVLADYGDFLVHVFSPAAREYYALERLWRAAKTVEIPAA